MPIVTIFWLRRSVNMLLILSTYLPFCQAINLVIAEVLHCHHVVLLVGDSEEHIRYHLTWDCDSQVLVIRQPPIIVRLPFTNYFLFLLSS